MPQIYFEKLESLPISAQSSGNNEIIPAPTKGYIAIDHINFVPTSAVSVTLKSGSTALSGVYPLDAKQPLTLENAQHNQDGVLTCAPGQAFNINLGGAVLISGFIRYRIIGK